MRKSRRGRWTDSKWSIKLEISEHGVHGVQRVRGILGRDESESTR